MVYPPPIHLDLERHRLDNGLEVVLHRDRTLPLVAVNIWYHVGSKNEEPGHTGLAHLFEHLLFQGSQHVGTNDHFRYVQQAGGIANGSTWFDRTNYYEILPAECLDLALWLESDRMGFFLPAITQAKLDNQREVVINERRQKIDNQPYGGAFERLQELVYPPGHPYRHPVIGHVDDLAVATLEDVCGFFRSFYVPNNAVLTLAGDIDYDDALRRIEHYFGDLPRGEPVLRPTMPSASPQTGGDERREILTDQVQLPRIYMAFCGPGYGTRGWYAADLLATALSDGRSSVMYEDLIYRRQLAQDVGCFVLPTEEMATIAVIATGRPGTDPEALESALREHLERVANQPLAADRIEGARNRLLTAHYSQLQSLERRADLLSHFTTFFDDPARVADEVSAYQQLRAEELVAFAAQHCGSRQRAVVIVVPEKAP